MRPADEVNLAKFLARHSKPLVFDRHFYSLDWSQHKLEANLINMVREPMDRIVSQFHYLRSNKRWSWRKKKPPSVWFQKDFNACVLGGDPECQIGGGGQDMQLTYFCGSSIQCSNSSSPQALQMAKYNAEYRFIYCQQLWAVYFDFLDTVQ